jgi:hypothetical protein
MTPALAADVPGADMARASIPAPPPMPDVPPPPGLPDPRPVWNGPPPPMAPAPAILAVDPRTRDIWLAECRRRMDISYGGWDDDYGWKRHRHHRHEVRAMGGDYCEVYFDDYYRNYSQAGYGWGYGPPMMMRNVVQPAQPPRNCVTEEHVTYEPVRVRYIPRRPVHKRIPDKRMRIN